jgi:hypothetical protein
MAKNSVRGKTMRALPLMMMCVLAASVNAATNWYVDSSATGTHDGTSWTNAWTALSQISGVAAGDTVLISGGPSGSTRSYNLGSTSWHPASGVAGNPVTYKIGQDSAHNGVAQFSIGSAQHFVTGSIQNVIISGDAGDGQKHFQIIQAVRGFDCSGSVNFRVSYVSFPSANNKLFYINGGGPGIELDHCYVYKVQGTSNDDDSIITMGVYGTAYDQNKIHDNEFHIPNSGNGTGDDGIQGATQGVSIYNNKIVGYVVSAYPRTQHQDGWQPLMGSYVKCYSNLFINIANYPVFGDAYDGDFIHCQIYNNIIIITDAGIQASDPPQGIAIGPDGSSFNHLQGRWPQFTDIVVANNLIADYGSHGAINLRNNPGQSSTFSQCRVVNNSVINSGGIGAASTVVTAANIVIHLSSGAGHFVSYTPLGASSNFHLVATDSAFRVQGTNLSSYFSTDKDGKLRAPSGAWDIGPYVYSAYNAPPPPVNLRVTSP